MQGTPEVWQTVIVRPLGGLTGSAFRGFLEGGARGASPSALPDDPRIAVREVGSS